MLLTLLALAAFPALALAYALACASRAGDRQMHLALDDQPRLVKRP